MNVLLIRNINTIYNVLSNVHTLKYISTTLMSKFSLRKQLAFGIIWKSNLNKTVTEITLMSAIKLPHT